MPNVAALPWLIAALLLMAPCVALGSTKSDESPEMRTADLPVRAAVFAYHPTATRTEPSTVSIALLMPEFTGDRDSGGKVRPEDKAFTEAIYRATSDYLTANRFGVAGPFQSISDISYLEGKFSELALQVEIDYRFSDQKEAGIVQRQREKDGTVFTTYEMNGDVQVTGTIHLTLWEPLTQLRLLTKHVPAPGLKVPVQHQETRRFEKIVAVYRNARVTVYEVAFASAMAEFERYLQPEAIEWARDHSKTLRDAKAFVRAGQPIPLPPSTTD